MPSRGDVAASISRLARGKLANGAKLDGLREVLLAMDGMDPAEDESDDDDDLRLALGAEIGAIFNRKPCLAL